MSKQTVEMIILFVVSMLMAYVFDKQLEFASDSTESIAARLFLLLLAWRMFIPQLAEMFVRD